MSWSFVSIRGLSIKWCWDNTCLRLWRSSILYSTLLVISWVLFLSCSRVRGPLVGDTKIISGLLFSCFVIGVAGTVVWFSTGWIVDVDTWAWLLVTNNDMRGGGLLTLCLEMVGHVPPSRIICWFLESNVGILQGTNRRRNPNLKGFKQCYARMVLSRNCVVWINPMDIRPLLELYEQIQMDISSYVEDLKICSDKINWSMWFN